MSNGAESGSVVAEAATAIALAIKASGAIVHIEPRDFIKILRKIDNPLVVAAEGGLLKTSYRYLTGYKGLVFFTKSTNPLQLDTDIETITAKEIWGFLHIPSKRYIPKFIQSNFV